MLIELFTESSPLAFDGVVLESFGPSGYRWHITQLERVGIERNKKDGRARLSVRAGRAGGVMGVLLPEESVPVAEHLLAAIDAARAERYGWPPVPRV